MKMERFDSYKQASTTLREAFGVNRTHLAGLMGVTEKSLLDWESRPVGDGTPKSKRLELLYEVTRFINSKFPELESVYYRRVLENSIVIFDHEDEEGFITLMNLIVHDPSVQYWQPIVEKSITDYLAETNFIKKEIRSAV
jgi:transcriptional regulator with XRE-family HTH domain